MFDGMEWNEMSITRYTQVQLQNGEYLGKYICIRYDEIEWNALSPASIELDIIATVMTS